MTIRYLKEGKPQTERAEDDAKVRQIVETTLADIEARGDAAVRELAEKFDNYSPASYRLTQDEIDALIAEVSPRDMEDIKFAHEQVKAFAVEAVAAAVSITAPLFLLVMIFQRQIVSGLTAGAVKG